MITLGTVDLVVACALLVVGAGAAGLFAWHSRAQCHRRMLREPGYRLIHELKAYLAWIEMLRGEPFTTPEPEQLTAAQALRNARAIAQSTFPELSETALRLLQGDSRLMRHLRERKLLRLSEPAEWVPSNRDTGYWQLRDAQEDLVEEMIGRCRVLMGEDARSWRGTDPDSEFFSTTGLSGS